MLPKTNLSSKTAPTQQRHAQEKQNENLITPNENKEIINKINQQQDNVISLVRTQQKGEKDIIIINKHNVMKNHLNEIEHNINNEKIQKIDSSKSQSSLDKYSNVTLPKSQSEGEQDDDDDNGDNDDDDDQNEPNFSIINPPKEFETESEKVSNKQTETQPKTPTEHTHKNKNYLKFNNFRTSLSHQIDLDAYVYDKEDVTELYQNSIGFRVFL